MDIDEKCISDDPYDVSQNPFVKPYGSIQNLAENWAPIDYQYITLDEGDERIKFDLLCPINFGCYPDSCEEKCWNTKKVESRMLETGDDFTPFHPVLYYSAALTKTHCYLLYSFYHAIDTTHINDLEGCMVVLDLRDDGLPELFGVITVAHDEFVPYSYKSKSKLRRPRPFQIRKNVEVESNDEAQRVLVQQESGKHGMYANGAYVLVFYEIKRFIRRLLGKKLYRIIYHPSTGHKQVTKNLVCSEKYGCARPVFQCDILDIHDGTNGFMKKYCDARQKGNDTFTKDGAFHGKGVGGGANGPWLWEPAGYRDLSDEIKTGAMWNDPQSLTKVMFHVEDDDFSSQYVKHMNQPNNV